MPSEGRGILSPVRLVAPGRKALQALDFQNGQPPPIAGIRDLMVTVTVTIPILTRLPNRTRATPERADCDSSLVHSMRFDCVHPPPRGD